MDQCLQLIDSSMEGNNELKGLNCALKKLVSQKEYRGTRIQENRKFTQNKEVIELKEDQGIIEILEDVNLLRDSTWKNFIAINWVESDG